MTFHVLLYPLIGIVAGLASGLLGVGGGIVVVPGLAYAFLLSGFPHAVIMHFAAGTALSVMIITSISSIVAHQRYNHIIWPLVGRLLTGMVLGVIIGVLTSTHLSTRWLEILLGLLLLFIAIRMFLLITPKSSRHLPSWPMFTLISLLIGFKSGLLGLGGGAIIIPFLTFCNVPMKQASGTSVACTLPMAIIGTFSFMLMGSARHLQVPDATGFIYWPATLGVGIMSIVFAQIGAYLNHRIKIHWLKRLFALFLLAISLNLLW